MKVYILSLITLFIFTALSLNAKERKLERSLSFDSGYLQSSYTNRAIQEFGIDMSHLFSYPFDLLSYHTMVGEYKLSRFTLALVYYLYGYDLSILSEPYSKRWKPFAFTNHEFGHALRNGTIGWEPAVYWDGSSDDKYTNMFLFFLSGFESKNASKGAMGGSTGKQLFKIYYSTDNWTNLITMAGVNNEMYFTEMLEDRILLHKGHFFDFIPYYYGKTAITRYIKSWTNKVGEDGKVRKGDINKTLDFYKEQGFNVSESDLKTASFIALYGSFTTYSMLYSAARYVYNGDARVSPFQVGGIKLPDIESYLNRQGVSLRLKSAFITKETIFPFFVEQIYKGKSQTELGLGIYQKFGQGKKFNLSSHVQAGTGYGLSTVLGYEPTTFSRLKLGAELHDEKSLSGARNIPKLDDSRFGYELFGGVSLRY